MGFLLENKFYRILHTKLQRLNFWGRAHIMTS